MTRPSISFRLSDDQFDALSALATRHDESPGQYVKRRWEAMLEPFVAKILAAPFDNGCLHGKRIARPTGVEVCAGCGAVYGADDRWRLVDHDEEGKVRIRLLAAPLPPEPVEVPEGPCEHEQAWASAGTKTWCTSCKRTW